MSGEPDTPIAEGKGRRGPSSEAVEATICPAAIAVMMGCIVLSLGQMMERFVPDWPTGFFVFAALLVSFEAVHADRVLARHGPEGQDRLQFHFVEWVVILLFIRLGVYIELGMERLAADAARWTMRIDSMFDGLFVGGALSVALAWGLASILAGSLREMEATPLERLPRVTDPGYYLRSTMPHHGQVDRQALLQRVAAVFWGGGALLLVFAGMAQADIGQPLPPRGAVSGIILNVPVYFLIGLLLTSQAQCTVLRAQWALQGIPVLEHPGRRWALMAVTFLLLVGLVSALLPVGYSVGILESVLTVIRWAIYILVQLAMALVFVVSLLLGLIMQLFSLRPEPVTGRMPLTPPPPPPPTATGDGADWWQLVRSLLFWAILVGIAGYSLYYFVLYRAVPMPRWRHWLARVWGWLSGTGRRLQHGVAQAARGLRREIDRVLAARRSRSAGTRRRIFWWQMDERQRVRYLYLLLLQQGERRGLRRAPSDTPLEYQRMLVEALPDDADSTQQLTAAFVKARYSEHAVSPEEVTMGRSALRALRQALRCRERPAADDAASPDDAQRLFTDGGSML